VVLFGAVESNDQAGRGDRGFGIDLMRTQASYEAAEVSIFVGPSRDRYEPPRVERGSELAILLPS
jgi:hypothetical protein